MDNSVDTSLKNKLTKIGLKRLTSQFKDTSSVLIFMRMSSHSEAHLLLNFFYTHTTHIDSLESRREEARLCLLYI